jgi:hypothetical protein
MKDLATICGQEYADKNSTSTEASDVSPYKVMSDDNFHYMEDDERSEWGTFSTAEQALDACRRLVDRSLRHQYEQGGVTAEALYDRYTDFGDDPFVVALDGAPHVKFSAWSYAKRRAAELTAPGEEGLRQRQAVLDRVRRQGRGANND